MQCVLLQKHFRMTHNPMGFNGIFADFGWKMTENLPQKVKISEIFVDF